LWLFGVSCGRFIHFVIEVPDKVHGHSDHEANAADAHDSIVRGEEVCQQFHGGSPK
jgi:hypothetical protein